MGWGQFKPLLAERRVESPAAFYRTLWRDPRVPALLRRLTRWGSALGGGWGDAGAGAQALGFSWQRAEALLWKRGSSVQTAWQVSRAQDWITHPRLNHAAFEN